MKTLLTTVVLCFLIVSCRASFRNFEESSSFGSDAIPEDTIEDLGADTIKPDDGPDTSIVSMIIEVEFEAGTEKECPEGGTKIIEGDDLNGDGDIDDEGEITKITYKCKDDKDDDKDDCWKCCCCCCDKDYDDDYKLSYGGKSKDDDKGDDYKNCCCCDKDDSYEYGGKDDKDKNKDDCYKKCCCKSESGKAYGSSDDDCEKKCCCCKCDKSSDDSQYGHDGDKKYCSCDSGKSDRESKLSAILDKLTYHKKDKDHSDDKNVVAAVLKTVTTRTRSKSSPAFILLSATLGKPVMKLAGLHEGKV